MPKKNLDEEKKKELEKLLSEIKENAPEASKGEIEELEKMLSSIIEEDSRPLISRIKAQVIGFIIHFVVMYISSILVFGFFFSTLALENKYVLFIIAGIIGAVLVTFERIPRNPFRRHFITINIMLFLIIAIVFCILNQDVFQVFSFSAIWIFYLAIVEVLYILIEYSLLSKIRLA